MKLPEKWSDTTTFAEIIQGTNIITTKTPLKDEYFTNLPAEPEVEKWTPDILKEKLEAKFNKRVGLVIDLTFTNKYYHCLDICKLSSDYYKLQIEGKEVPGEAYVQQFIRVIDTFNKFIKEGGDPDQFNIPEPETKTEEKKEEEKAEEKKEEEKKEEAPKAEETKTEDKKEDAEMATEKTEEEKAAEAAEKEEKKIQRETDRLFGRFYPKNLPDISECVAKKLTGAEADSYSNEMMNSNFLIVVHCTHGVNRAGYMVARYLIDRFGLQAEDAMKRVTEARGVEFHNEIYARVLADEEVLDMARQQVHYTYLADKQKYFQYKAATRFKSDKFLTWKKTAKRKMEEATKEAQPEEKIAKITLDEQAQAQEA